MKGLGASWVVARLTPGGTAVMERAKMEAVNEMRANRGEPTWEELDSGDTMEEAVAKRREWKHRVRWTDEGLWCENCRSLVNPEKGSRMKSEASERTGREET